MAVVEFQKQGPEAAPALSPAGFDYSTLPADVAENARATADRIRRQWSRVEETCLQIGQDLLAVRERLEHGQFVGWLKAEFPQSVKTAYRFMDQAERLGARFVTVTNLPPSTRYRLAAGSTPSELRNAVLDRLEAGDPLTPADIDGMIADAKEAAKAAKKDAKLTPKQRGDRRRAAERHRRDVERERLEAEERRRQRIEASRAAARLIAESMKDRLTDLLALLDAADLWRLPDEIRTAMEG